MVKKAALCWLSEAIRQRLAICRCLSLMIGGGSFSSTGIYSGVGTPEGSLTAAIGSLYLNTSGGAGTTLYVKQSGAGNTGWVGK